MRQLLFTIALLLGLFSGLYLYYNNPQTTLTTIDRNGVDMKIKQIYKDTVINILHDKYGVTENKCETNNYEITLLFQMLDELDLYTTMDYYSKYEYTTNPKRLQDNIIQQIEYSINTLDCDFYNEQRNRFNKQSINSAEKANKITAKYMPIDADQLSKIINDDNHELTKALKESMDINNSIDYFINLQVACAKREGDLELADKLAKQKECTSTLLIGH